MTGSRAKLDVFLGLLSAGALFFIQAFHAPGLATPGLDPSWRLALSEAHVRGLQFGQDIVFTFGPLGYLMYGLPVADTYVSMVAASVAVALVCAVLGVALAAEPGIPVAVRLAFVLALAVVLPEASESLYLITVFAWMLPVFRVREHRPVAASALGLFSGIVGLTEFKLAFVAFFGGIVLFGGRGLLAYRAREGSRGVPSLVCFLSAYCVAFGFQFAVRDYGAGATLAIVALAAVALALMLRPQPVHSLVRKVMGLAGVIAGLALVLSPTCRAYVAQSGRLASGYSAAMSKPGNWSELDLAMCVLALLASLAAIHRKRLTSPVAAAIALGAFGAFKEGFVRQDPPHVLFFFVILVPVTAAIALLSSRRAQLVPLAPCLLALGLYDVVFHNYSLGDVLASSVTPSVIAARAATAAQTLSPSPLLPADFIAGLAGDVLPKSVQADVGSQPADVLPWETAVIFANGFTWDPEPVFQSYSVISSAVDEANATHLENRGASRIFYQWGDIDGRYPLWGAAAASATLLCRYRLGENAPSIVTTKSGEPFLALKRTAGRCDRFVASKTMRVMWGEQILVPSRVGLTFAKLSIRYNLLGYLTRSLFRVPGLDITISKAAQAAKFRVIAETSNDGILIDPLPEDLAELGNLFSGLGNKIQSTHSFSIETDAPYLYQSGIDVQFVSVAYHSP